MAASGKTNNLKLPIYVEGNETTSWADYNESMQKIDIFAGENSGKTNTNTDAIQTINDQLQTIVTEQNNNNETTQRLDGRVQSIDRNINTINGTLSSHNQRIATLEAEGGEIGSLLTTVTEHTTEIGQLKTDSASQNTQIQKNKTDIASINNEIQEISGDVASAEADIAALQNRISYPNTKILYNAASPEIALHGSADIAHKSAQVNDLFMLELHGYCSISKIANNSITLSADVNYLFSNLSGFISYYDAVYKGYTSRSCTVSQTGDSLTITINPNGGEFGKGIIVLTAGKSQS